MRRRAVDESQRGGHRGCGGHGLYEGRFVSVVAAVVAAALVPSVGCAGLRCLRG